MESNISLRDYFAAKVIQGLAASSVWSDNFNYAPDVDKLRWIKQVAEVAYAAADAMIEEKAKQKEKS